MIETSGHLPECPWADRGFAFPCICDRLRACEQRVRQEERNQCTKAIRARRDTLLEQMPARPLQTRNLASAIYEDAIATLRLTAEAKPITTYTP